MVVAAIEMEGMGAPCASKSWDLSSRALRTVDFPGYSRLSTRRIYRGLELAPTVSPGGG